jgi:hypothetical protein
MYMPLNSKNTEFFDIDGIEKLIGKAKDARAMSALLYFDMEVTAAEGMKIRKEDIVMPKTHPSSSTTL